MESTTTNIGDAANVFLCANCVAYRVEKRGDRCKRCSPEPASADGRTDAELGLFVTFVVLAALGLGSFGVVVFLWIFS